MMSYFTLVCTLHSTHNKTSYVLLEISILTFCSALMSNIALYFIFHAPYSLFNYYLIFYYSLPCTLFLPLLSFVFLLLKFALYVSLLFFKKSILVHFYYKYNINITSFMILCTTYGDDSKAVLCAIKYVTNTFLSLRGKKNSLVGHLEKLIVNLYKSLLCSVRATVK